MKTSATGRVHIRFSKEQYQRLLKDHLMSGKSMPWLLKTAYFKKEIAPPTLDLETRKAVRRELAAIGNNLNQIARNTHLEKGVDLTKDLTECIDAIRLMKHFLGLDHGNR